MSDIMRRGLLGGPPRCGKTIVARRLAGETGSAWLQTDYLEAAFAASVPAGESAPPELATGPGVPRERRNDAVYARYSAAEIVGYLSRRLSKLKRRWNLHTLACTNAVHRHSRTTIRPHPCFSLGPATLPRPPAQGFAHTGP